MVKGGITRPIRDQVKEALFNILGVGVESSSFLDLFAGTGSVGIEALSRGASRATFVEKHPLAVEVIHANLDLTKLGDRARVVQTDVFQLLKSPGEDRYDYVYVAPPQYSKLWSRVVLKLDTMPSWLNPDAWVIAQIHPKEFDGLELGTLVEIDRRTYGRTMLAFYELPGE
jgi:16S rRNA (guanine(966)-N(2))-methyltransferase RsmD